MEAVWSGDVDRVRALTLQAWGTNMDQPPLKMAIADKKGNSPFSIAFYTRNYSLAKTILEIIKTQWSPKDVDQLRYKMESQHIDVAEYSDEDDDESDDEPRIVSEKVDKTFTIDNIGQVSMLVKSHTTPLEVICARHNFFIYMNGKAELHPRPQEGSLFDNAVKFEDVGGLKFLLDAASEYSGKLAVGSDMSDDEAGTEKFTFPQATFDMAIHEGKVQMLGTIIKRAGAGIPLDHLVKKSGIDLKKKPRYYQGLTVYGRKRYVTKSVGC